MSPVGVVVSNNFWFDFSFRYARVVVFLLQLFSAFQRARQNLPPSVPSIIHSASSSCPSSCAIFSSACRLRALSPASRSLLASSVNTRRRSSRPPYPAAVAAAARPRPVAERLESAASAASRQSCQTSAAPNVLASTVDIVAAAARARKRTTGRNDELPPLEKMTEEELVENALLPAPEELGVDFVEAAVVEEPEAMRRTVDELLRQLMAENSKYATSSLSGHINGVLQKTWYYNYS